MSPIDKILLSPIIHDPWPHKIVDNLFSDHVIDQFNSIASSLVDQFGATTLVNLPGVPFQTTILPRLDQSTCLEIAETKQLISEAIPRVLQDFSNFTRKIDSYTCRTKVHVLKDNLGWYPLHPDTPNKIISIVTYIWPEKSTGTVLHNVDQSYHSTVEWKQNRSLIFCRQDDTWHTFGTTDAPRITMDFFIEESTHGDTVK